MKKFFALVLCMLMLLTCFVGCAEENEAPATEAAEAADEVTQVTDETVEPEALPYAGQELNVWTGYVEGTPAWEAANTHIAKFEEMTGAKINVSHYGTDLDTMLITALGAGEEVDVFPMSHVTLGYNQEYTMDLTDRIENSDVVDRIYPVLMDIMREYSPDDTLRGIPTTSSFQAFWYNKAAFEAAGITETPETMEEFETACDALIEVGYHPMALDSSYALITFGALVERMVGEDAVSEMVMEGGFSDNEEFVAACQKIIDWRENGYFEPNAPGEWPASQNKIGLTEDVALVYCGMWVSGEIEEMTGADLDWGCFKFPYVPESNGTYGATVSCTVNCINANTKNPDLAWDYLCYMNTGEANKAITDADVYLVDDRTMEPLPEFVDSKHIMETTTETTTYHGGLHANADIKVSINDVVVALCSGQYTTGEEAAAAFDALVS